MWLGSAPLLLPGGLVLPLLLLTCGFCTPLTRSDVKADLSVTKLSHGVGTPASKRQQQQPHPVILVPGDGGSQLEMRLNRSVSPHYYCARNGDWVHAWVNYEFMAPYVIDCWVDSMRLVYDVATRRTRTPHGVSMRVRGWGDPASVEFVDQLHLAGAAYFIQVVDAIVKESGLKRNESIRGAPYDFRRGPNELGAFFANFADLVEDTYRRNGNQTVVLVCHSMGCPLTKFMLTSQTPEWRARHVRALVALAGAWGGSVKALKGFASGETFGIPFASAHSLRVEERSFPSLAFLAPSARLWPDRTEVVVQTAQRNYTVQDYDDFFQDIGYLVGAEVMRDVSAWQLDERPPGVETFCVHGQGVPTVERLDYRNTKFPDGEPNHVMGDGDGSVNIRSLRYCARFAALQNEPVHVRALDGTDHMAILKDARAHRIINAVINGNSITN